MQPVCLHAIICLASSLVETVSRFDTCSLMRTGGPGSIPGAHGLTQATILSGSREMSSN
jgi:hypothetical protein